MTVPTVTSRWPFAASGPSAVHTVRRLPWRVIVLVAAAYLLGWTAATWLRDNGFFGNRIITDIGLYHRYATSTAGGALPYRDFAFEYPPLALPAIWLPVLLSATEAGYRDAFIALMRVFGSLTSIAVIIALALAARRRADLVVGVAVAAASPILLVAVLFEHYDLWPALLAAVGLAFAAAGHLRVAAATLALGALAKVYPAVAIPVVVIAAWRRHGAAEAVRTLAVVGATSAIVLVPSLVVGLQGVLEALGRYIGRPLQVEGLGGSLLLALRDPLALPVEIVSTFGSENVVGGIAPLISIWLLAFQLGSVVYVWMWFAGGAPTVQRMLRAAVASVVAYVAFGKVVSPQYLVWLLPFVAIVPGPRGWAASALVAVAAWITNLYFPGRYADLVAYQGAVPWVVFVRDLALVAAFVALMAPREWLSRTDGIGRRPDAAATR